ncbi:MAG: response regulator [Actinobacteria bacterium]|nr:response regulator [Actinomycetota bacterium]
MFNVRHTDILVTLPLRIVTPAKRTIAAAEPAAATAPKSTLRILLIEDNPVNRILAQRQITRLGHDLDVVTTGTEGADEALHGGYDVVLVDRHLPDIDGVEVTRRIRTGEATQELGRRVPIIGVSADALPRNREECLDAGMDAFLTKPLDLQRLAVTLEEFAPAGSESTGAAAVPYLDHGALKRVREELDEEAVRVIVQAYLDDLPTRRLHLQAALGKGKARPVAVAAGRLCASSLTVGAERLAHLCRNIESAAHAGDLDSCRALLPTLADVCTATVTALTNEVPSVTPPKDPTP